jgi:succinate dehydrogenase / fumarate reductase cytochrome b subunit
MNPAAISGPRKGKSVLGWFAESSIGAKWVMAVTGILFFLWLVAHLLGNLQVFAGQAAINYYAGLLHKEPVILWGQRVGLFIVVVLHVAAGIRLSYLNRKARPERYQKAYKYRSANPLSRTMIYTGVVLLAFIVFHLVHFTFGGVLPSEYGLVDPEGRMDVFTMMVRGFQHGWVVLIYLVGMALLAFHLSHGAWSSVQTLGLNGNRWTPFALKAGPVVAVLLTAAFASIPIAIAIGIVQLP